MLGFDLAETSIPAGHLLPAGVTIHHLPCRVKLPAHRRVDCEVSVPHPNSEERLSPLDPVFRNDLDLPGNSDEVEQQGVHTHQEITARGDLAPGVGGLQHDAAGYRRQRRGRWVQPADGGPLSGRHLPWPLDQEVVGNDHRHCHDYEERE